jgi:hypothetical protein
MARTPVATQDFTGSDATDITTLGFSKVRDVTYGSSAQILTNKCSGYFSTASVDDSTTQNQVVVMVRTAGTYSNDQYAKATISGKGLNTAYRRGGVIVRSSADTDANADFYAFYNCDDASNTSVLCKVVNGTFTSLGTWTTTAWANGDTIELEVSGTTLTPYRNGSAIAGKSATDSALASGRPGLYIASHTDSGYRLDDWEGGDVSSASATALLMLLLHG